MDKPKSEYVLMQLNKNFFITLCLSFFLASCVTHQEGVFTKKDDKKAVEYSVQLARAYTQEKNWEQAKVHLKNALEIDSKNGEVHEALAMVFQNTGEFELAEEHYKKALIYGKDLSQIRLNYAIFLMSKEKYKESEDLLEKVVADTLYSRRDEAFIRLGYCQVKLEKFADAEKSFERAYLMNRDNLVAVFELANVYYELGDFPKSQLFYDAFRQKSSNQSARSLWLGIRLADKFDDKNALSSYTLALKNLYPKSAEYLQYKAKFNP